MVAARAELDSLWARGRAFLGTDVALINGIMHEIVAKGLHDREFIAQRTEGFAELEAMLGHFSPERAEEICGVPADTIREIAHLYATSQPSSIL